MLILLDKISLQRICSTSSLMNLVSAKIYTLSIKQEMLIRRGISPDIAHKYLENLRKLTAEIQVQQSMVSITLFYPLSVIQQILS